MSWIVFTLAVLSCFYAVNCENNGALTKFYDYQYVVAIIIETFTNKWLCTGGIIHPQYILTAAHCFSKQRNKVLQLFGNKEKFQKGTVTVYAGTDSRKVRPPTSRGKVAMGLDVYFIEDYFKDLIDDIAILKLDSSLDVVRTFMKLELPKHPVTEKIFLTAGYGSDPSNDKKKPQNAGHLKDIVTLIVDNARCNRNPNTKIHGNRQFCAISRSSLAAGHLFENGPPYPLGICVGDSGSPIVTISQNIVKGVVSTAPPDCDSRSYPEVHMNVEAYVDNFINPVLEGTYRIHPSIIKRSFINACSR